MPLMDETDRQILNGLQENARLSRNALAQEVGISPAAVHERIKKLEKSGLIHGYRAILDPLMTKNELTAFVLVSIGDLELEEQFIKEITDLIEVQECHHVTGEYSLLLKVRTQSIGTLQQLLLEKIGGSSLVSRTNTMIALSTAKEATRLDLRLGTESATDSTTID